HPSVKQIDAEIAELNNQKTRVQQEVSVRVKAEDEKLEKDSEREVVATLQSQLTAAQQRLSRAIGKFDDARERANIDGQAETKLTTLNDGLKNNRELLNTYTQRQKEQELALASGRPNNITVQNHAITPTSPIGP